MRNLFLLVFALLLLTGSAVADWPTYRHDAARSGVSPEAIPLPEVEQWVFTSPHKPRPAWSGPARRDGWHKSDPLKPRMIFDWAFHVVASDGAVYFGSSADDQLYCLDAGTGEVRWTFFAEGPIRLAPTIHDGKAYFGSDDGFMYCIDAKSGEELWRYEAAPDAYRLPGNSRIMSISPVRTGVTIYDGMAYFCGGLFSHQGAFVCALDATTGAPQWKKKLNDAPQGYMLASEEKLYVARGRSNPLVLRREDGRLLYAPDGDGGSFCVLVDDYLFHGPGHTGQIEASNAEAKKNLVTFQGNQIVIDGDRAYMQTDSDLSAMDRARYLALAEQRVGLEDALEEQEEALKRMPEADQSGPEADVIIAEIARIKKALPGIASEMDTCELWKKPIAFPYALVLAGDYLYAGGENTVGAVDTNTGEIVWSAPIEGRGLDIAIADERLIVSTDQGVIYSFGTTGAPETHQAAL